MIKMDSVKLLTIIVIVSLIILLAGLSVWAFRLHGGLAAPLAAALAAACALGRLCTLCGAESFAGRAARIRKG